MTEDQILIAAIKTGDERAFQTLMQRHQGLVANTCFGMLQDRADADDVTQEVFIEVFRSIHKFRGDSKLSTWLYRIAVTRSIDLLRKRKRRNKIRRFQTFFGGEEVVSNMADNRSSSAQELLENEERAAILAEAVAKLPENQRVAFTLSKYEDLTYQKIAEVMNKSVPSVESLLFRAKKNLKVLLTDYYSS